MLGFAIFNIALKLNSKIKMCNVRDLSKDHPMRDNNKISYES